MKVRIRGVVNSAAVFQDIGGYDCPTDLDCESGAVAGYSMAQLTNKYDTTSHYYWPVGPLDGPALKAMNFIGGNTWQRLDTRYDLGVEDTPGWSLGTGTELATDPYVTKGFGYWMDNQRIYSMRWSDQSVEMLSGTDGAGYGDNNAHVLAADAAYDGGNYYNQVYTYETNAGSVWYCESASFGSPSQAGDYRPIAVRQVTAPSGLNWVDGCFDIFGNAYLLQRDGTDIYVTTFRRGYVTKSQARIAGIASSGTGGVCCWIDDDTVHQQYLLISVEGAIIKYDPDSETVLDSSNSLGLLTKTEFLWNRVGNQRYIYYLGSAQTLYKFDVSTLSADSNYPATNWDGATLDFAVQWPFRDDVWIVHWGSNDNMWLYFVGADCCS